MIWTLASGKAHLATVANTAAEFAKALADPDSDWVYLRFLPSREEISAVRQAGKKAFISGPPMVGHVPDKWHQAAAVGIDAILTDYPLDVRKALRQLAEQ